MIQERNLTASAPSTRVSRRPPIFFAKSLFDDNNYGVGALDRSEVCANGVPLVELKFTLRGLKRLLEKPCSASHSIVPMVPPCARTGLTVIWTGSVGFTINILDKFWRDAMMSGLLVVIGES